VGKVVKKSHAMTGELSLTGKVMAIGGLKEKVIAARRTGTKVVLFPQSNLKDWEEIPEYIRKGLEFHLVDRMEQVIEILLGLKPGERKAPPRPLKRPPQPKAEWE
jgi:ATP-dependent Lon protease